MAQTLKPYQWDNEDLFVYQALFDQFQEDNSAAETGQLLSLNYDVEHLLDGADLSAVAIERLSVGDFDSQQAFVLRNFLSPAECQSLVAAVEASGGLAGIAGVKRSYRSCSRAVFNEPRLASRLFQRLLPYLPQTLRIGSDPVASQRVFGPAWLLEGDWRPHCLNPVLRVCRYEPGQHFSPHYDGHLVHSDCNRSLQTFMVYLTDNPPGTGGATNFLDDSLTMDALEKTSPTPTALTAPRASVLCSVQPEAGSALVFNHYRLHEGEPLLAGVKYILRSDIMYERVGGAAGSATQREALKLLQEAERLESRGAAAEAVAAYRRAFKLCPELEGSV